MSDVLAALAARQAHDSVAGGGGAVGANGGGGGEEKAGWNKIETSITFGFPIFAITTVNLKSVDSHNGVPQIKSGILSHMGPNDKSNAFNIPQDGRIAQAHRNLIQGVKDTADKNFAGLGGGPEIGPSHSGGGPEIGPSTMPSIPIMSGLTGISGGESVAEMPTAPMPVPSSGGGRSAVADLG